MNGVYRREAHFRVFAGAAAAVDERRGQLYEIAVLFVTLFRSGFLGLFLIGRGSISHIVPPLSESRCGADWGRRPPW